MTETRAVAPSPAAEGRCRSGAACFPTGIKEVMTCGYVVPVRCWRRAFPGTPEHVRAAREFVRLLLPDQSREDDIPLVVSELVSNAVRHSRSGLPGGHVVLEVRSWDRWLALAVIDQGGSDEPLIRQPVDPLAEGGRGLPTVAACATWWCWHGDARGRTVTAFFRGDDDAASTG